MENLQSLLPGIVEFLENDLANENLSPACEERRQGFLERLEVLHFGEVPAQPLVRPGKDRKVRTCPQKRYSMPPLPCHNGPPEEGEYEEPKKLLANGCDGKGEDSSGDDYENELPKARAEIVLPKRSSTRRFSTATFADHPWTMVGPLSHRYKPQKWQRLSFCVLAGTRLLGYKSTHSLTPSFVVFLAGYTAIYAERDSGMSYVIKLTHPAHGTHVLAADSNEQALQWTQQMNQYAQGTTPTTIKSYMDNTNNASPETQEDSGFSAPVSSGSEGGSGDGVVGVARTVTANNNGAAATAPTKPSEGLHSRGSGLISSMRRKVESFNSKRKSRKALSAFIPDSFHVAEDAIIAGRAKIRIPTRGAWRERWCQLRRGVLDAFRVDTGELDFALSLDNIALGQSNDKKHRSALRLSCSDVKDVLLFEVADKIEMGSWIRGFIQALGIIPNAPYENHVDWVPLESMSKARPPGLTDDESEDPIYDEVCPPLSSADSGTKTSATSPNNIVIPPPSRRLLAQPLPPLPDSPVHWLAKTPGAHFDWSAVVRRQGQPATRSSSARARCGEDPEPVIDKRISVVSAPEREMPYVDEEDDNNCTSSSTISGGLGQQNQNTCEEDEDDPYDAVASASIASTSPRLLTKVTRSRDDEGSRAMTQNSRLQGCSLADLIARYESSEDKEPVYSEYTAVSWLERITQPAPEAARLKRCISNDTTLPTDLSRRSSSPRLHLLGNGGNSPRGQGRSLVLRRTSLETNSEEVSLLKDDVSRLRRQKTDLKRISSSSESVNCQLEALEKEITEKVSKIGLLELERKRRFTVHAKDDPTSPSKTVTKNEGVRKGTSPS